MSDPIQNVRVCLPNGAVVWVEAKPMGPRETDTAGFEGLAEALSLDAVRRAIEGVAALVRETLEKAKPDKASVEFGLEMGLECGQLTALWVKGSGKANLKITLSWEK